MIYCFCCQDPRLKADLSIEKFEETEARIINNIMQDEEKINISKLENLREKMFTELYKYEVTTLKADLLTLT